MVLSLVTQTDERLVYHIYVFIEISCNSYKLFLYFVLYVASQSIITNFLILNFAEKNSNLYFEEMIHVLLPNTLIYLVLTILIF
jgi:hypothetical protein